MTSITTRYRVYKRVSISYIRVRGVERYIVQIVKGRRIMGTEEISYIYGYQYLNQVKLDVVLIEGYKYLNKKFIVLSSIIQYKTCREKKGVIGSLSVHRILVSNNPYSSLSYYIQPILLILLLSPYYPFYADTLYSIFPSNMHPSMSIFSGLDLKGMVIVSL